MDSSETLGAPFPFGAWDWWSHLQGHENVHAVAIVVGAYALVVTSAMLTGNTWSRAWELLTPFACAAVIFGSYWEWPGLVNNPIVGWSANLAVCLGLVTIAAGIVILVATVGRESWTEGRDARRRRRTGELIPNDLNRFIRGGNRSARYLLYCVFGMRDHYVAEHNKYARYQGVVWEPSTVAAWFAAKMDYRLLVHARHALRSTRTNWLRT